VDWRDKAADRDVCETGLLHGEAAVRTRVGMMLESAGGGGRAAEMNSRARVTDRFSECLFRVCPTLKYEATSSMQQRKKAAKKAGAVGGVGGGPSVALHFVPYLPISNLTISYRISPQVVGGLSTQDLHFLMSEASQERESNASTLAAVQEAPTSVLYGSVVQVGVGGSS
jgi:hypothetical protein